MNATKRFIWILTVLLLIGHVRADDDVRRLLYVAEPGIRNYVEFGGHGILVFDIDDGHKFVKRIPLAGLGDDGQPLNVKGVCANAATHRIYVSTLRHLMCVDLVTDELLWEKPYEKGCDRMSMTPDGTLIYLPTLEKEHWKVIAAETGDEIARISPDSGSHNTVVGLDGLSFDGRCLRYADARARHATGRRSGPNRAKREDA